MRATTGFIRLFIRGLAWDAAAASASFADTLKSAARAKLTDSTKGKVLTGTSSGGTVVTYTLPPLGTLTGEDVAEVCSRLLDRVDIIKAADSNIDDEALVVALLAAFQPIRSVRQDFSCSGIR